MGLENNKPIEIVPIFGFGSISILAAGLKIRIWQFYIHDARKKERHKEMYIRRIGAFTTPPHGNP